MWKEAIVSVRGAVMREGSKALKEKARRASRPLDLNVEQMEAEGASSDEENDTEFVPELNESVDNGTSGKSSQKIRGKDSEDEAEEGEVEEESTRIEIQGDEPTSQEAGKAQKKKKGKEKADAQPKKTQKQPTKEKQSQKKGEKVSSAQAGGRGKVRAHRVSRAARSGLVFSVSRLDKQLREGPYSAHTTRFSADAPVYLGGVLEYLTAEILELGGDACVKLKKRIITPRHLFLSIKQDQELNELLKDVLIASGGAKEHIHSFLLKRKSGMDYEDDEEPRSAKKQKVSGTQSSKKTPKKSTPGKQRKGK
jgi:histone H2A